MEVNDYLTCLVGAHIFFIKDGTLCMIRRKNTGHGDGKYSVPAGHVDAGERMIDAAIREAKEEVGVSITEENLTFAHMVHIRKRDPSLPDRLQFFFVAHTWDGELQNCEPEKCDDIAWFPIAALPDNCVEYTRQAFRAYQSGITLSTLDE